MTGLSRNQIIAAILSIVILVAFLVFAFWPDSTDENSSQPPFSTQPPSSQSPQLTTVTTRVINDISPEPFTPQDNERYLSLPTTGEVTPGMIADYISPRYEAILGGDPSSPIPISEINKASNSDLSEELFNLARSTAINIARAEITGLGTEQWPAYFQGQPKGICYNFNAPNAGALKLPISSQDNWIVTYIYYSAICPTPSGPTTINQMMNIYFINEGGKLTPKVLSQVPKN